MSPSAANPDQAGALGSVRAERVSATREAILSAAERLFAERGLAAVSNRQVSEAAGQGNNAAVGYHFGTKADLVRAIVRKHAEPIERLRRERVARIHGSGDPRDWISCWVRPVTDHLGSIGSATWFARFGAQLMADPAFRKIVLEETFSDPVLNEILDGLNQCTPSLPVEVRLQRNYMARLLVTHGLAECEGVLAGGAHPLQLGWRGAANGLIDALTGLWLAPITPDN
jgi:AcrR family transcriptional regulator